MASPSDTLGRLLRSQKAMRVWSLVITFFGDSVVPLGGEVWLGTVTRAMGGLAVDDQAVRAAISRLTKDGWLERKRLGRNSYYRLAENGNREFLAAAERIYGPGAADFDGYVSMLVKKGPMKKANG